MNIIQRRKIYFTVSILLVLSSIVAFAVFGLKLGIDFTGGSLLQIKVADNVQTTATDIQSVLTTGEPKVLESVTVQPTGERGFILRFKNITEDEHQAVLAKLRAALAPKDAAATTTPVQATDKKSIPDLSGLKAVDSKGNPVDVKFEANPDVVAESSDTTIGGAGVVTEDSFESIGPTVGSELKQRSIYSILAVLAAIIIYIAWAFRKVSQPVASWKYGVAAVIALTHDVFIPVGIFAVLGHFLGVEVDILFVTAILTILGFSVHDTIVVFDRIRENLAHSRHRGTFEEIVNISVNETVRRSINTSMTAFLALLSIFIFGGESIKYFVLALMLGIIFGTYSSIFIASPLLVVWNNWSRRQKQ